ncbi:uncharacterized protein LOC110031634 isoform X2 [Phalaenopsis equestris]|uniref:uncharacterized protein LOC110031634 isoform X2 n=1 Tax=Phalaenopsis equestris TaxID=78828 RepID=UPI0009E2D816|nr:uncharacterized protein LOC110031634 isoform X2 [Phalaenopsis equestris]
MHNAHCPSPCSNFETTEMLTRRRLLAQLLLVTLYGALVSSEHLLEPGYSISTVLDFNKPLPSAGLDVSGIIPFALHPLTRSPNLLLLLDSSNSAFYSLDLPLSQESHIRLLSGNGTTGFSDGDAISTMFKRPRSFAVDYNDNVYVADRITHVIRKINGHSGVTTTIAGGYTQKEGHTDGSAQNATFSADFDLLFMHKMCSLLICDRGNRMIRQMDLKPEDCEEKPQSSKGLGAIPVSVIAAVALLCGLGLGFIARPFVTSSSTTGSLREPLHTPLTESNPNNSDETSTDALLRHQKRSC